MLLRELSILKVLFLAISVSDHASSASNDRIFSKKYMGGNVEESGNGPILGTTSTLPIPVASRSKAWNCGRSLAGIGGSGLFGVMDVRLL